jgi:hypothetical protein
VSVLTLYTRIIASTNLLLSLIVSCPPLYLLELGTSILEGSGGDSDKDLLRNFSSLIKAIVGSRQDSFYTKRLGEVCSILMEAVTALDRATKRRRTISSAECLPQSTSSYHAFQEQTASRLLGSSHGDGSYIFTGNLGADGHTSMENGFAIPGWESPVRVRTLANSRDGDFHAGTAYEHVGVEEGYNEDLFSYLSSLT